MIVGIRFSKEQAVRFRNQARQYFLMTFALGGFAAVAVSAVERRAPAPTFNGDAFRGVFFDSASEAIRGTRPELGKPQIAAPAAPASGSPAVANGGAPAADGPASGFALYISASTLEDEVKQMRSQFDGNITTPAAFASGGFQKARVQLTVLASLFGIINEYTGDVRFKKDAAAARDLMSRAAANCKSGSAQVYNEAKQRKADLEDLISGTGLSNREAEATNDWGAIADRVPLMTYLDALSEGPLKASARDEATIKAEADRLRKTAELISAVGMILTKEGLDDADDADYQELCKQMIEAGKDVTKGLDQGDPAVVTKGIGSITKSCSKCHEGYR